jgi:NADH dehydrogenase
MNTDGEKNPVENLCSYQDYDDMAPEMTPHPHRVVIVGGGFGGLYAAKALRCVPVDVTLIDRRNFHLFQPLLYQVATGGLSPADIASPLRAVLSRQKNTTVLLGEMTGLDRENRRVLLKDRSIPYDSLIVATGAVNHYFGNDHWAGWAPGLKSVEDAIEIRRRVFQAFECAESEFDDNKRRTMLTFVIVGGGPTGVELAGALGEIANETLKGDFRRIDPSQARILLLEGGPRILTAFPESLAAKALKSLNRLGVEVLTNSLVINMAESMITIKEGGRQKQLATQTVVWAAGIRASSPGTALARNNPDLLDRTGRIKVAPDLTVHGYPEIYVIGDLADFTHQTGKPLPGTAPVAMSQGKYAAKCIRKKLAGKTVSPYRFSDKGNLATIGRAAAVADFNWLRLSGFSAWVVWLFVHLMYLVEYDNRLLVFVQWAWNYFTKNRGARLITTPERRRETPVD